MKIWQKIFLGFSLAVLLLTGIATTTYRSTRGLLATTQWVAHSRQVLERHESLRRSLIEAENSVRAYLLAKDEEYLPEFEQARSNARDDAEALRELVSDNPEQQGKIGAIALLIGKKMGILKAAIAARRDDSTESAALLMGDGDDRRVTQEIARRLREFELVEQQLLAQRTMMTNEIGRSATAIIVIATVLGTIILGVAAGFILRDVRARRRAEEALAEEHNLLSSVIDATPDHIFVKDFAGCYVLDNAAHRKFLGVEHLQDVVGKKIEHFLPRNAAEQLSADDRAVLETGQPVVGREEPIIDPRGKVIWLSVSKLPLRDRDGRCTGMLGLASDISIRKQSEERLERIAESLKRSNHELQDFASVASHDLQEPLRKIQAFGDRLKVKCGAAVGEDGRDYIERMQSAARRMQTLLHDLLTLSRVTSRAKPFETVDLAEIVRGVMEDLEVRTEQTGAHVELGYLPIIEADPTQMRQLLQNLISNAMKFQRPGSVPEVIVSAKVRPLIEQQLPGAAPGDAVCQIMVQDNGIGFDEKYLDRIFIVFQRLHSRSDYEGTGIGLAVCRKILERHGGIISAKSAEGQGATFIVTLPVKQRMKTPDESAWKSDHDPDGG